MSPQDDLIRRMMASAPVFYSALIDQGRKIGGDPVGHRCGNHATGTVWCDGVAWPVCGRCAEMLLAEPQRVTLNPLSAIVGKDG